MKSEASSAVALDVLSKKLDEESRISQVMENHYFIMIVIVYRFSDMLKTECTKDKTCVCSLRLT